MEIFISAGEASSDIHSAHLVRELKALSPDKNLKFFGLGGDRLAAEGVELLIHNREFSVAGGPLEVMSKIPLRWKLERMLENALFSKRVPMGAILVDNGELNLRLASLLHFFNVPIVYFIPPKVWVWRHSRIDSIEQHVDLVLSILPFEEQIYKHWEIPFQYVGNPLIDEVKARSLSQEEAKQKLGIDPAQDVLTIFLGSRHSEVKHHIEVFGRGVKQFLDSLPESQPRPAIALPVAPAIDLASVESSFVPHIRGTKSTVKVFKGQSHECLRAARAALVKSGTSTLEAALLGTPMVLAYASSKSTEFIYRHIVRYKGFVGLVNLFLAESSDSAMGWDKPEKPVVPELILDDCTPERIAQELVKIYVEGPERQSMIGKLARTPSLLLPPSETGEVSPLKFAARSTWDLFSKTKQPVVDADA